MSFTEKHYYQTILMPKCDDGKHERAKPNRGRKIKSFGTIHKLNEQYC